MKPFWRFFVSGSKIKLFLQDKILLIMKKSITCIAVMLVTLLTACAQKQEKMTTIYDFKALNNKGEEVDMAQYKGKVLMIVNTASKCGFTPQYDGLEALYKKYQDQGLVILGFPCDQFKHQEPGSDEEIAEFCRLNHGVTFPLMKKIDVFGENAHPIFVYLCNQVPDEEVHGLKDKATMKLVDSLSKSEGRKDGEIRWNFTKFLISKDGSVIKRFPPVAEPKDMEADIEAMLK